VRVSCSYCGAVNDVASPGAVRVARELERLRIRLPDRSLTVVQIEADFAERAAAERARLRTVWILALALSIVFVTGLVLALTLAG
jgi:hypothetical protein